LAKRILTRLLALALVLLGPLTAGAQRFSFQRYGEAQGLFNLTITDLLQDHEGYIWVATFNGVYKYDGTSFQRFGETEGIPPNTTLNFLETPDGNLWAVSGHVLFKRDGSRFRKFELSVNLDGSQPVAWLPQASSFVLATTAGLATVPIRGGVPGQVSIEAVTGGPAAFSVYTAPDGALWYSTSTEVCRRQNRRTDCYGASEGVAKDRWAGIRMDKNGELWIRSEKRILRLPAGAKRFEAGLEGLPPAEGIGLLNLDREGDLFVPTEDGLARLVKGRWQLIGMRQGMTSDDVQVTLEDREGSLWIGHLGAGLERWRGYNTWEGWTELEGLPNSSIFAIEQVATDRVFLGSDEGLAEFQPGRGIVRTWHESDGLAGNHVYALSVDDRGDLWIGSAPGGLSRMNRKTGRIDRILPSSSESVLSLQADNDGSMWAATERRILHFERTPSGGFRMKVPPGSPPGYSPGLLRDSFGRLWSATSGNLFVFGGDHWTALGPIDWLPPGSAFSLAEGADGAIYVLTVKGQVLRIVWRDARWVATALPPLSAPGSLVPYFFHSDRQGALWVGTDRGVFTLQPNSSEWRWYTEDDGLIWNDTNLGAFHQGLGDDVWIGTSRGLAHFAPTKLQTVSSTPRAAIVSLVVNGRKLDGPGPYSFGYPASSVQFHVTALTFTNEERNRFLYRLRGVDGDWLHTSSHEIAYSDLRPGTYTFDVLAQSPDGRLSSEAATAIFVVRPPWFLTRTFLCIATVCTSLLLFAAFRWRMRLFLVRQKELEAAVTERTRELRVEREFEREQAHVMEMIVSSAKLDEILDSIAEMVRSCPPGFDCVIALHPVPAETLRQGTTSMEIPSAAGQTMGWIYFAGGKGNSSSLEAPKVISVARRLATVALETRSAYEKLDHQANYDLLTGLANRLRFQDGLQAIYERASNDHQGFAVIYIDLNRFKEINDRYGHRVGDLFLQEVANRFRSCMRKGDLLARVGGDEFAAVIPDANSSMIVERIVLALENSLLAEILLPGCTARASASFGFSMYPNDSADCESLIRVADQAMYRAKQRAKSATHLAEMGRELARSLK